jgi:small subunit ribosomal protein S21
MLGYRSARIAGMPLFFLTLRGYLRFTMGLYTQLEQGGGEAWMPAIIIRNGESFESALRRFKKQCERTGILSEVKRREYYEKPSVKRKKKILAAKKRVLKKMRRMVQKGLY